MNKKRKGTNKMKKMKKNLEEKKEKPCRLINQNNEITRSVSE
jgi:hypothetical protein